MCHTYIQPYAFPHMSLSLVGRRDFNIHRHSPCSTNITLASSALPHTVHPSYSWSSSQPHNSYISPSNIFHQSVFIHSLYVPRPSQHLSPPAHFTWPDKSLTPLLLHTSPSTILPHFITLLSLIHSQISPFTHLLNFSTSCLKFSKSITSEISSANSSWFRFLSPPSTFTRSLPNILTFISPYNSM